MIKRLVFLLLLSVFLMSACSSDDILSGKTFDVSVVGSPTDPGYLQTIVTLEFSDENTFKNTRGNEEGTYELSGDKLLILIEDENEKVEIEFTLKESDKELSEYSAELTHADFQMEDTEKISKYKGLYQKIQHSDSYVISAQK